MDSAVVLARRTVLAPTIAIVACIAILVIEPLHDAVPYITPFLGLTIVIALVQFNLAVRDARSESEQRRLARTDELTGLVNRRGFVERGDATSGQGAIVLLDLDAFKDVNDTHGHATGDALLGIVGERLARAIRPGDTMARLGGDEFAVILPGASLEDAMLVGARMLAAVEEPIAVGAMTFRMTASAGADASEAFALGPMLQRADRAMYDAKADGRACLRVSA